MVNEDSDHAGMRETEYLSCELPVKAVNIGYHEDKLYVVIVI